MTQALSQQIEDLRNVIAWSKENGGLTIGQRICINQEIAGILKYISVLECVEGEELTKTNFPRTTLPPHLEQKVNHITGVIKNSNWKKQFVKY